MIVKRVSYFFLVLTVIYLVLILISGCGSAEKLQSNWSESEMKIDGDFSDWENSLHAIDGEGVSLGFKNDNKSLYFCLITVDRGKMMQMMRSGFIVWFIPQNSDSKVFGIKYPMPLSLINLGREERQDFNKDMFQPEKMQEMFSKMLNQKNEFQIINEENFPLGQFGLDNKEGIKVKLGYVSERFIYELQVPLRTNNYSYSIAAQSGEKLKIKFETLESEFEGMPAPGMGRGMRPPGRGTPREEDEKDPKSNRDGKNKDNDGKFTRPEPFNYEVELQLHKQ